MNASAIKIDMLVRIYNQEHIWHNKVGVIETPGPVFSRIELSGRLVQIPNHWLVEVEERQGDKNDRI